MKVVQDLRELFSYRELIAVLAQREIRSRYKYTLLGAGWALALPVGLMLIFTLAQGVYLSRYLTDTEKSESSSSEQ